MADQSESLATKRIADLRPSEAHPTTPEERKEAGLRPTGNEIFQRMTRAEQDEQFGPEKAEALRSGSIALTDLVGTSPLATEPDYIVEKPLDAALR